MVNDMVIRIILLLLVYLITPVQAFGEPILKQKIYFAKSPHKADTKIHFTSSSYHADTKIHLTNSPYAADISFYIDADKTHCNSGCPEKRADPLSPKNEIPECLPEKRKESPNN